MFKKNYKKAMDRFTPSEAVDNKIEKMIEEEGSKRSFFNPHRNRSSYGVKRFNPIFTLGLVLIIFVSLWPLISKGNLQQGSKSNSDNKAMDNENLALGVSYSDIYEIFNDNFLEKRKGAGDYAGKNDDFAKAPLEESMQDNASEKNVGSPSEDKASDSSVDYSGTNIQEEDVDEADIVKTDGRYIYMAVNNKIEVSEADKGKLAHLATIDFSEKGLNIREIYLQEDILAIIASKYQGIYHRNNESDSMLKDMIYPMNEDTLVYYFDVTEPSKPKDLGSTEQSGFYLSSRIVDGTLYLVTNKNYYSEIKKDDPRTYIPSYKEGNIESIIKEKDLAIAPGELESSYIVICAYNLESQKCTSSKAILGGGRTVYASKDNIYISMTKWKEEKDNSIVTRGEETVIIGVSLNNGTLGEPITGTVPGYEVDQFAMDEHKGYLRIVTTENIETYEEVIYKDGSTARIWKGEGEVSNGIYVLDKNLKVVGGLSGLAPEEYVYSVRFFGDIAYFVTFRQVDPLFTVDLSNPERPTLIGSLKIPGFSDYLQGYGEGLLFGFGQSATEEGRVTGLKLSMFDTSNPGEVKEANVKELEGRWSEASYNHKAILASESKDIIAFATENYYFIYGYQKDKGFYEKAAISLKDYDYNTRGIYIGDYFYVCTSRGIASYDMNKDYAEVDSLKY